MTAKSSEQLSINSYNYHLPDNRIAKYPLEERADSKLLLWNEDGISEDIFHNLNQYLPQNSLLVYNNTKVIHARLLFQKVTGAKIEIFCLEPTQPFDYALSLASQGACEWKCIVGNLKKWKEGTLIQKIETADETISLQAELIGTKDDTHTIRFSWDNDWSFSEILKQIGQLPIPPYLHRKAEEKDNETYQTVYSQIEGSVAAPTAGLHFTNDVLESLKDKGIQLEEVTLHVGAGTFQPVKTEYIDDHIMHAENFIIDDKTIQSLLKNLDNIIAIGTTTVRTLESLYYIGLKIISNSIVLKDGKIQVSQWEPYQNLNQSATIKEALTAILDYMKYKATSYIQAETQILIKPGFQFRLIKGIITNFHQPKSTLLLLVSAFVGSDWKNIYDYAMAHNFRFLSYGDSSFLLKKN